MYYLDGMEYRGESSFTIRKILARNPIFECLGSVGRGGPTKKTLLIMTEDNNHYLSISPSKSRIPTTGRLILFFFQNARSVCTNSMVVVGADYFFPLSLAVPNLPKQQQQQRHHPPCCQPYHTRNPMMVVIVMIEKRH